MFKNNSQCIAPKELIVKVGVGVNAWSCIALEFDCVLCCIKYKLVDIWIPSFALKGFGYFFKMSIDLQLTYRKILIVESFPSNITYWGAVVFEKWVKQWNENTFVNA